MEEQAAQCLQLVEQGDRPPAAAEILFVDKENSARLEPELLPCLRVYLPGRRTEGFTSQRVSGRLSPVRRSRSSIDGVVVVMPYQ